MADAPRPSGGRPPARRIGAAVAGGLGLAALVGWSAGLPPKDMVILVGLSGGAALVAGAAGCVVLWRLRASSVGIQAVVVALTALASCGAGVATAAAAMFVSRHDLAAVSVVLVIGASVGAAVALFLGHMSARNAEEHYRRRQQEEARRELVAWVSHDLRTPLAGMKAMVEALEDGVVDDPDTVQRYYRAIGAETNQLARLVEDLLELSRVQSPGLRLNRERVSFDELVSDAVASAAPTARAKRVKVHAETAGSPPVMTLDVLGVTRAVRNVLDNAIRHTPPDGGIFVKAGGDESHAFVSVADGCGGIPTTDLDRVFDLAFRGDSSRSPGADGDAPAGAGLGLAIARGLVEAHEGRIEVANQDGGCCFTMRFPRPDLQS
jgi:signal transduction histidine kinase